MRNWGVLQPGKPHGSHSGRAGLRKDGSSLQGSWSQVLCRLVTVPDLPQPFFFLASQKLVNQIAYHSHLLTTFLPTSQDKNPDVDQKSSKAVLRLSTVRWDREKALGWTQKLSWRGRNRPSARQAAQTLSHVHNGTGRLLLNRGAEHETPKGVSVWGDCQGKWHLRSGLSTGPGPWTWGKHLHSPLSCGWQHSTWATGLGW